MNLDRSWESVSGNGGPQPRLLIIVLILSGAALAGCLDDGAADGQVDVPADPGVSPANNTTMPEDDILTEVDVETAVFAPDWEVGWGWTYDVSGTRLDQDYSFTVGVVEVLDDRYKMATDTDAELMTHIVSGGSLFLDGVKKETLEVDHQGEFRDLIGFKRKIGATWEASVFGIPLTLTKAAVDDIDSAAGSGRGIRVTGTSPEEHTALIEYAGPAGFISKLEITDKEGENTLTFSLTAYSKSVSGLKTWEVTDETINSASGSPNYVGPFLTWESEGSGDGLFLRIAPGTSEAGRGHIVGPDGEEKLAAEAGDGVKVAVVDDIQGTWETLAVNNEGGTRCDVQIFQFKETTY